MMKRLFSCAAGLALAAALAHGQAAPEPKPPLAGEVFKNVQVMKDLPVDEFMSTMGIFSAALGMSCENCHAANDAKWENYAADNTAKKRTARAMVAMMTTINKNFFGGRQMVTCYSCHHGGDRPKTTPNLDTIYGHPPEEEPDDFIEPAQAGAPTAGQILDKYIQALGGAQRLSSIASFVARGSSSGYGPESGKRAIEVYAKSPAQRTVVIHTLSGDNTTVYDGRQAWISAPLRPVAVIPLTGGELGGARFDAALQFPANIKQAVPEWKAGRATLLNDRKVQVLQGAAPGGVTVTLYFDDESGLLVRSLRFANSLVGRVPTQTDYSDYREVNGVKMPFRWTYAWLDGREDVELTSIQANAAIDASKFAKPAPPAEK